MTVKERIIEEASELFGRSGVKGITMDDLARHLGISKRTIYENFKDKEDLLVACIDAFHDEGIKINEKVFFEMDNIVDAILDMLQKSADQTTQLQFNMMTDIRKYYPQVYKEHLSHFHADKYQSMKQLIQQGINEGVFRNDLNSDIIAHFFCNQGDNIVHSDKDLDRFSLSDVIENIAITFLRGICTAKGVDIIDKYKNVKSLKVQSLKV